MRILIGRHHSTDLRDTTKATFFELLDQLEENIKSQYPAEIRESVPPIGEMHKADNDYEFSNGSMIHFRPLDEAEKKYKSLNVAAIGIDEASEIDVNAVQMLMGRRRQMGFPLLLFVVSNPTSYTHWLYKWFVKERTANYHLFRNNTFENKTNIPPGYIEELTRKYPIDWVRRYVEGEWGGIDEGIPIYGGLFQENIHVQKAFFYKRHPVWIGVDFGYTSPGVVWAQADKAYRCQIIKEWAPKAIDTYNLCQGIIQRNGIWFPGATFQYFCGHDGSQHAPSAEKTGVEIMTENGMTPSYRYHHLEAAFTVIRNMLKVRDDGTPNLIVDPAADICIESFMGAYKYKPESKKDGLSSDKPLKDDIHDPLMDAFRYIAYQNYSLSGDSPYSGPRIPAFRSKKIKDPSDDEFIPPSSDRRTRTKSYAFHGWRRG